MAAFSVAILVQSCFTGVETTPKITAGDVKKAVPVAAPEETFLASVRPQSFSEWKPGKKFYVADNRVSVVFASKKPSDKALKGTELSLTGWQEVTSITGKVETEIGFKTTAGDTLVYRSPLSPDELRQRDNASPPFLVDVDMVDKARDLLAGKTVYVISSLWRDHEDNSVPGRKYVPVKITDVLPGTSDYPLCVDFTEAVDSASLSGSLFVTPSPDARGSRTFQSQFSLKDPRLNYPLVSPEDWELISYSRVAPGMTREECRLALGAPTDLERQAGYSSVHERWTYENGVYLIFNDGILTDFRR